MPYPWIDRVILVNLPIGVPLMGKDWALYY